MSSDKKIKSSRKSKTQVEQPPPEPVVVEQLPPTPDVETESSSNETVASIVSSLIHEKESQIKQIKNEIAKLRLVNRLHTKQVKEASKRKRRPEPTVEPTPEN
jgi:hypothetical protein